MKLTGISDSGLRRIAQSQQEVYIVSDIPVEGGSANYIFPDEEAASFILGQMDLPMYAKFGQWVSVGEVPDGYEIVPSGRWDQGILQTLEAEPF
jgi:hypothetical protein